MTEAFKDWNDASRAGFSAKDAADAAAQKANGHDKTKTDRIRLIPFADITLSNKRRDLVKGLIPRTGLIVVWGPPKCGKSFWVFDLMMKIALGVPYRGRRVEQGAVVYCAFEGQSGIEARAEAYRRKFLDGQTALVPFYLEPIRLDLVGDHVELIATIKRQLADAAPVSVVLDTLNRSLRGSESSDEDMAAYIAAADAIRETFQCAVVIVHHCGVDDSRPRGHTSLRAAADCELRVRRNAAENIVVTVDFSKDGPSGEAVASRLEVVEVGADEDGQRITSCVVVAAEDDCAEPADLTRTQSGWLSDLTALFAERDLAAWCIPVSEMTRQLCMTRDQVRDGLKRRGRIDADANGKLSGSERTKMSTNLNALKDKGKIGMTDRHVWLIQPRQ